MQHEGKARQAAWRLIGWTLIGLVALFGAGLVARALGTFITAIASGLVTLWLLFAVFTLYFFRDPEPRRPSDPGAIVAPAHGRVDVIEETVEPTFLQGKCRRISIFLSVFDVHVQHAPVSGPVVFVKEQAGQFLNAMRTDSAQYNENVLIGFEPERQPEARVGVRLIAGLIARRIVRWVEVGQRVERSDRISLIQFGSRVELYLPLDTTVHIQLGTKVKGGETVVASFP